MSVMCIVRVAAHFEQRNVLWRKCTLVVELKNSEDDHFCGFKKYFLSGQNAIVCDATRMISLSCRNWIEARRHTLAGFSYPDYAVVFETIPRRRVITFVAGYPPEVEVTSSYPTDRRSIYMPKEHAFELPPRLMRYAIDIAGWC